MQMTPNQIREMLVMMIIGNGVGGDKAHWCGKIGEVRRVPRIKQTTFDWRVTPQGTRYERKLVDDAAERLRMLAPYALW